MITILTYVDNHNIKTRIFNNETDARNTMTEEYNTALAKTDNIDSSIIKNNSALIFNHSIMLRWQITQIPDTTLNRTEEHICEIKLKNGKLVVDNTCDPDYPGIDIEFIPYKNSCNNDLTNPRVLIEQPKNKNLRVLIWADPESEDYSDNIEFNII